MGFSRQEYWSGLPCLPPGDLPNPGIKPAALTSPALSGGLFTTSATLEGPSISETKAWRQRRTETHTHSELSQSSGRLSLKEERRTLEISAGTEDKGQNGEVMGHSSDPEALQPGCAVGGDALGGQHRPECLTPSLLSPMPHRQEISIQLSTHSKSVENGLKLNKQQTPDADKL